MVKEYIINIEDEEIHIQVIRSDRRTMALEIQTDGQVIVRAPKRASDRSIKRLITSKARWIYEKRSRMFERQAKRKESMAKFPVWEEMTTAEKKQIKAMIAERVEEIANHMGVTYGSISVRNQKSRWGSCSSQGNLNFNYRLAFLPPSYMDYVIVHELAHRRHMDHSKEFWAEVEAYYPEYKQVKKELAEIPIL